MCVRVCVCICVCVSVCVPVCVPDCHVARFPRSHKRAIYVLTHDWGGSELYHFLDKTGKHWDETMRTRSRAERGHQRVSGLAPVGPTHVHGARQSTPVNVLGSFVFCHLVYLTGRNLGGHMGTLLASSCIAGIWKF